MHYVRISGARRYKANESRLLGKKERAEFLVTQITYLHNEQSSIQNSFLGILYIPLAFIGVMVYYAYNSSSQNIFLLLPFLLSWCIANLMKYTLKCFDIHNYIIKLEEEFNQLSGSETFAWETRFNDKSGYTGLGTFAQGPCLLIVYALLIYEYGKTVIQLPSALLRVILLVLLGIQIFLLVKLGLKTLYQYQQLK